MNLDPNDHREINSLARIADSMEGIERTLNNIEVLLERGQTEVGGALIHLAAAVREAEENRRRYR